jgi:hypothetical protein
MSLIQEDLNDTIGGEVIADVNATFSQNVKTKLR